MSKDKNKLPETLFIKCDKGNYHPFTPNKEQPTLELPPLTYVVDVNEQGFFLRPTDPFKMPKRIYGKSHRRVERYIQTYEERQGNTGVMLVGPSGSGKTLEAMALSLAATKMGWPTLIINRPFGGDAFNEFIARIKQDALVLIDEFEKVYSTMTATSQGQMYTSHQEPLLTLLSGTVVSKKLFVLTCNDISRVDQHMQNRPSRIYYTTAFNALDVDVVMDYIHENLKDKKNEIQLQLMFMDGQQNFMNFDMLVTLVSEINRYGETPLEAYKQMTSKDYVGVPFTLDTAVYLTYKGEPVGFSKTSLSSGYSQFLRYTSYRFLQKEDPKDKFQFDEDGMDAVFHLKNEPGQTEPLWAITLGFTFGDIQSFDVEKFEVVFAKGDWKAHVQCLGQNYFGSDAKREYWDELRKPYQAFVKVTEEVAHAQREHEQKQREEQLRMGQQSVSWPSQAGQPGQPMQAPRFASPGLMSR